MATYFAWSTFTVGRDEASRPKKTINPGDTITAEMLGVSKEEFQEYIDGGSVRTQKYPDVPPGYTGSPIEWLREKAAADVAAAEAGANAYADVVEAETLSPPVETPTPGDIKKV